MGRAALGTFPCSDLKTCGFGLVLLFPPFSPHLNVAKWYQVDWNFLHRTIPRDLWNHVVSFFSPFSSDVLPGYGARLMRVISPRGSHAQIYGFSLPPPFFFAKAARHRLRERLPNP